MKAVAVSGVSKAYGALTVLKDLSLDIRAGEFVVLLGPSGCGKSTLLHAIAGLDDIDAGDIRIGDKSVVELEPKDRGIAMVFQSYALYPTMDVRGNLAFGLRMKGIARPEIDVRVARAAQMLQIDSLLTRKPSQLSGGQRQRVAIGRALVREAEVFLFDEPLSNLDAKLRTEMRLELKRLHTMLGATMIYVTHDQVEAMTMADRVAVLRAGRIEQFSTPQDLYDRPANLFVASFVGTPEINRIAGRLVAEPGGTRFRTSDYALDLSSNTFARAPAASCEAVLAIRAEDLSLHASEREGLIPGRTVAQEPLGPETLVWCETPLGRLCSRIRSDRSDLGDAPVWLGIDAARISLFDAASGERL